VIPSPTLTGGSPAAAAVRSPRGLPPLLSVIAGMVDVIGYLGLGNLFTAHVTGNIVVIAATLVRGASPNVGQVLAVPVFIVAVAVVGLIAKVSAWRGPALLRPLLLVQFLLLASVLLVAVRFGVAASPDGTVAGLAAVLATSAMACQFALLRLAVPGAPSTAVMTGNLTSTVLTGIESLAPDRPPLLARADERLRSSAALLVGFFVGCVAAGVAASWVGDWAWSLPVVLAGAAVAWR
jgi:uncharacterized membrane protein YoaK (UPF0700 family)